VWACVNLALKRINYLIIENGADLGVNRVRGKQ